ncbi:DUF6624 domain-containing protein [Amycolatopsis sp. DG1A-15b]|uniref:DUF6624 domain-containing protein n=1 Tax=Amycolatopsis sp. DG1A-15b TaxID=3052846 RepID=UPI00255B805F|nr:DUF6624 domain-containing protein [Amycolatopsis sp. DG1A-15b]WIX85729.1 hypothetical protein QRY02_31560 [Amycolatopsis sp. DG1A-15b]
MQRVDEDNLRWLAPIVSVRGWPGVRAVGTDGAHAAWILSQHAPAGYSACWLPRLCDVVARGEASPRDLAYLADRVATDEKRGQRYGTQRLYVGGLNRLYPLHRPAEVNLARADVGLDPLPDADLDTAYTSFEEIAAAAEGAPS